MKLRLLLILALIISHKTYSQKNETSNIIENAVKSLNEAGTIIYVDSSSNFNSTSYTFLSGRKIHGFIDSQKITLKLGNNETLFLKREFKKDSTFKWNPNLFKSSIRTSLDSMEITLDKFRLNEKNKRCFLFSRPIFFRNNTLMIFRLSEFFTKRGGNDYMFIFKKIKGYWYQYMKIYSGSW